MVKCDMGRVEIEGIGVVVCAEMGVLLSAFIEMNMKKAGMDFALHEVDALVSRAKELAKDENRKKSDTKETQEKETDEQLVELLKNILGGE